MLTSNPLQPAPLRRATSRTRTAPEPLARPEVLFFYAFPFQAFSRLYAGPVDAGQYPPTIPGLENYSINYPFTSTALQVFAFAPVPDRAAVVARELQPHGYLILDLGQDVEVARLEMYGNLLLPPLAADSGPLFNFGLPRAVGVAVLEEPQLRRDLHDLWHIDAWLEPRGKILHSRYECRDLRAGYGWTTIHLPPTYGRFLLLYFADLPLIYSMEKYAPIGRGVDIQRLVLYPYLEDVDHHPAVEGTLLSVWQTRYPLPDSSDYWNFIGELPKQPETHQSLSGDRLNHRLPWPSVFSWLPVRGPATAWSYESDLLELDSDDRLILTLEATTDEIPVLDGLRLYRLDWNRLDPKEGGNVAADEAIRYHFEVYVTTDPEAAWSQDILHPSWRLVNPGFSSRASNPLFLIPFTEPVRARYVRLLVKLQKLPTAQTTATCGRLNISGIVLARCRDFILAPEPEEDIQVESVLLRLRGANILEDYAFIDGQSGFSLTLEARREGGPFQEIRSFRTLLDLVENSNARLFSNPRFGEKPVQKYQEQVTGTQSGQMRTDTLESATTTHTYLPAGRRNVTVSRTGSTTQHVQNAKDRLLERGDPDIAVFPDQDTTGVQTKRIYEGIPPTLPDPTSVTDAASFMQFIQELINDAGNAPIPINFGVGFSGSLGAQAGFGGSFGVSVSGGGSVGGGNTRAVVRGRQASVADSQTTVLYSDVHQMAEATGYTIQSRDGSSTENRSITRTDLSEEKRRAGLSVQYGGRYEDIILVTIPVRRTLSGLTSRATAPDRPPVSGDMLRLRVDHLPQGVKLDVEFRGMTIPRREP